MKQGEIFWAEFQGVGRRPVIVVGRNELNRGSQLVIAPLTSMHVERRSHLPNCVPFAAGEFGLNQRLRGAVRTGLGDSGRKSGSGCRPLRTAG